MMRIDELALTNFKLFKDQTLTFDPQFTLLVGENGSGKTSVLDALAIALGIWLGEVPDQKLRKTQPRIRKEDARIEWVRLGDRSQFQAAKGDVSIRATGRIENVDRVSWEFSLPTRGGETHAGSARAVEIIRRAFDSIRAGEGVTLPIVAYYGAGRAWLPHRDRPTKAREAKNAAHRWAAFDDCLNERIRVVELVHWFRNETTEAANRGGRFRPGFEIVKRAILQCIPDADGVWFDVDREDIVLSINGNAQPLINLSGGQRMMLALVADIAIRMVIQNNYLVPSDALVSETAPPAVLAKTPGVVLIDELDVHLHPRWQRRVAGDLKKIFPGIQFVCTSHSPQVIGELAPNEIRLLDPRHVGESPAHSLGLDSNAILVEVMEAEIRNVDAESAIAAVEKCIDDEQFVEARKKLDELRKLQRGETTDTIRLEASINNLESASAAH